MAADQYQEQLCCLCLKPIRRGLPEELAARYMGRELGLRNVWAHTRCWNERYHPVSKQEPAEKQAGLWEVSE